MKDFTAIFFFWLTEATLFGIPAFLAYNNIQGWGWFLFAAVLIGGSLRVKTT